MANDVYSALNKSYLIVQVTAIIFQRYFLSGDMLEMYRWRGLRPSYVSDGLRLQLDFYELTITQTSLGFSPLGNPWGHGQGNLPFRRGENLLILH